MWLFFAFLAIPLIEIALFIQVGGLIGLWLTLAIVIVTAFLGTVLVRSQGSLALQGIKQSFENLNDPTEPLAHGAMILFSGALLLTPGFFTDAIGFALLIPAVRSYVFKEISKRVHVTRVGDPHFEARSASGGARSETIEGEYEIETDEHPRSGPSGWTRD